MRTIAYLQVVPKHSRSGKLIGCQVRQLSQRVPNQVMAGAMLLRLTVEVPDAAFAPIEATLLVPDEVVARDVRLTAKVAGGA